MPEEFVDPVTAALMTDPVVLPSNNVVDRRTIKRHMLTQATDPFTQVPLAEQDIRADAALKARIDTWLAERLAAAHAASAAAAAGAE